MIGPEIPAHLLAPRQNEDAEEEEESVSNSIGPQIHSHLLQHRSTAPADEDEDKDDDDAAGPMPDTSSTKSMIKGVSGKTSRSPGPSTGRRPIGPTLPTQLSHRNPAFDDDDDDDDDDEIGPRPPPSGSRREEEDAVKRFMEVEESRRKKIEEASKPKALKREEWMLKPPSSSELLGSLDPSKLKAPRQFSRSTAPSRDVDNSLWTETPAEKQQRLADEVMGKRRRAADPDPEGDEKKRRKKDEENVRRGVEEYNSKVRGPSLLERHAASEKNDKDEKPLIWDHARDMALGGRLMDDEKRSKFIKESGGLGDRFSSGKGGFL